MLVDVSLGEESGFELTRRLVAEHDHGGAAVILISTASASDLADLLTLSPAAGYLPKSELSADAIREPRSRTSSGKSVSVTSGATSARSMKEGAFSRS